MEMKRYYGTADCDVTPGAPARYKVTLEAGTEILLCGTHACTWAQNNNLDFPPAPGPDAWIEKPPEITLNMDDGFERAVAGMIETNRRKRQDYAQDGDPYSNFRDTAELMGIDAFTMLDSARFNIAQKVVRLKSLRQNGRPPNNETVQDTYLDLAVYAVILYSMSLEVPDA
jgi:hypothetical protein